MTVDRVFVVAGHFNEFRRYCQDSGLNVPRQARFVRDGSSLRGLAGPIEVVWLEGAVERVDFDELRAVVAEINRSEAGIPKSPHRLNRIEVGDRFRINDENFVLTGVLTDVEGCQQLTLARPGSFCHQASETAPPPDEGMLIRGQLPAEIAKTLQDQGLIDLMGGHISVGDDDPSIRFQYEEPQHRCKCGFRAPELGPHPDCPIHPASGDST